MHDPAAHDFYDRLENRSPSVRETALFRDLNHLISISRTRAPSLRAQLKGVGTAKLRTRQDLAKIPIRRRHDLIAAQSDAGPLAGYVATRTAALAQVFVAPGSAVSVSGQARDWWGMARALYAAGLRKGMIVLNAMSYDLVPYGHMVDAGAREIGCPTVPAGNAHASDVSAACRMHPPHFFCGTPGRLKQLLDHDQEVGHETVPWRDALLVGTTKHGLRSEFKMRGVNVRHAVALPECGVVAYECGTTDGMTLAEGFMLEIVDPVDGTPVDGGAEGEIVLSRINLDFPLIRFGTGLISSVLQQTSTCGRTNVRIKIPRAHETKTTMPHIDQMRARHPGLPMRLVGNPGGGPYHLRVERRGDEPSLADRLQETLRLVTRQRGTIEFVAPGSLKDPASDEPGSE